jgi:outer membrane lipoprotein carrier protein
MKRALRTLIFASLLAVVSTPAGAAGLRDVIEALEAPFRNHQIKDYTADFFQESRIASLDRLQRARGEVKVRFEAQGRDRVPVVMFHWEYQEPTRQELVSDGKTLWVYLPENNQVIQSDIGLVSQARDNDPMTFLTGLGQLSRDFQINFASPNRDVAGNYILDLRPRRTTALINRMVIVVDRNVVDQVVPEESKSEIEKKWGQLSPKPEPGGFGSPRGRNEFPILSTTVYDPNGNSTIIEFSNVRVNVGLSPGTFRFMLPAGVEVVRPTGKEMGF